MSLQSADFASAGIPATTLTGLARGDGNGMALVQWQFGKPLT